MRRRDFLKISAAGMGAVGGLSGVTPGESEESSQPSADQGQSLRNGKRPFNSEYHGEYLNEVAFPIEGTGTLSHVSLRNHPEVYHEPCTCAAVWVKGKQSIARVLEGPVPRRKLFGPPGSANGSGGATYGLPRFSSATFITRFPFAVVRLSEPKVPLEVELTGWSPFEPDDADNSSLPVVGLEYKFTNRGSAAVEAVFSFNTKNFMAVGNDPQAVRPIEGGFILWTGGPKDRPWEEGAFSATVSERDVKVNHAWFRGGW